MSLKSNRLCTWSINWHDSSATPIPPDRKQRFFLLDLFTDEINNILFQEEKHAWQTFYHLKKFLFLYNVLGHNVPETLQVCSSFVGVTNSPNVYNHCSSDLIPWNTVVFTQYLIPPFGIIVYAHVYLIHILYVNMKIETSNLEKNGQFLNLHQWFMTYTPNFFSC